MSLVTIGQVQVNGLPMIQGTGVETVVGDTILPEAESVLAQWLCFPIADDGLYHLDTTTYTVFRDGARPTNPYELVLPIRPVVAITTVHQSTERVYDATTLVAAADYELDRDRGVLMTTWNAPRWYCTYRAQKVVFTAGFGVSGAAPRAIILAVAYQCQAILSGRRHGPVVDQVENGQAEARPQLAAVDPRAKSLLSPFRLWEQEGLT